LKDPDKELLLRPLFIFIHASYPFTECISFDLCQPKNEDKLKLIGAFTDFSVKLISIPFGLIFDKVYSEDHKPELVFVHPTTLKYKREWDEDGKEITFHFYNFDKCWPKELLMYKGMNG